MDFNHRHRDIGADAFERRIPAINAPWIVLALIGLFVMVQLGRSLLGQNEQIWFSLAFAFTPARYAPPADLIGYVFPGGEAGDIWTFVSHMFLHGDWTHLIINSVWMLIFGSVVARQLGPLRFVLFSAVCAAAGAGGNLLANWGEPAFLVGASGAISGQMAAAIRLMYAAQGRLSDLNRRDVSDMTALSVMETLSSRRALTFIVVWMVANLVFGLFGGMIGVGGTDSIVRIAWEAHVGGFVGGFLLFGWFGRGSVR